MTLIERHCYEVPILIKPNWACEIVNLLIRVRWRLFVLLHYFGDKFSVGALNFHSVGRLIVGYLTERSMWRNFDNSEHLLGLTEGQTVPNSTGDLHQLNFDLDEKTEFLMSPWAQGMYHSYASHENITIYEGIYQRGGFMFRLYLFSQINIQIFRENTAAKTLRNKMSAWLLWTDEKRRQRAILNERRRRHLKPVSLAKFCKRILKSNCTKQTSPFAVPARKKEQRYQDPSHQHVFRSTMNASKL